MASDTQAFDFGKVYKSDEIPGMAFIIVDYLRSESYEWDDEFECEVPIEVVDTSTVIGVAIGDDYQHQLDADMLHPIDEDDFCPGCGSTICGHYR